MGDSDLGISVPRELIVLKILSSGWHRRSAPGCWEMWEAVGTSGGGRTWMSCMKLSGILGVLGPGKEVGVGMLHRLKGNIGD